MKGNGSAVHMEHAISSTSVSYSIVSVNQSQRAATHVLTSASLAKAPEILEIKLITLK